MSGGKFRLGKEIPYFSLEDSTGHKKLTISDVDYFRGEISAIAQRSAGDKAAHTMDDEELMAYISLLNQGPVSFTVNQGRTVMAHLVSIGDAFHASFCMTRREHSFFKRYLLEDYFKNHRDIKLNFSIVSEKDGEIYCRFIVSPFLEVDYNDAYDTLYRFVLNLFTKIMVHGG